MEDTEYAGLDGLGLAERIAARELSAQEVVEAAQRRARQVNPRVNAIVRSMDGEAAARLREPLTGPFAGVPFLIKDLGQEYAGLPSSAGCRALSRTPMPAHSTVVQRWLDAGLVIFGKTNTPEFGAKGVTEPDLFGPARNPFDLSRTTGGSSGGAAAAVAAGIVPVAGASDGGGSIRIPAACCGLFGLKAGRGLIPFGPGIGEPLHGTATNGVISRSVRDTAAMLDVLAGPDETVALRSRACPRVASSTRSAPTQGGCGSASTSARRSIPTRIRARWRPSPTRRSCSNSSATRSSRSTRPSTTPTSRATS